MELVVPLCSRWRDMEDVTVMVKGSEALAVGRTEAGFDERTIAVEEVAALVAPYMALYNQLAEYVAAALGVEPISTAGNVAKWLKEYVTFIDMANAKWGKIADRLGPFTVRRTLDAVYIPISGHALTLTYVAFPYRGAVVWAENKGKVMAIGSVVVEWGGVKVASMGIRTLGGAFILAQAAPELAPELEALRKALLRFVESFRSISGCQ